MATIQRRGVKQWRVLIRRKGYPVQTKTFESKSEASSWASLMESEMARGVWLSRSEAERTTLADALERYGKEITPSKKGARQERNRIAVLRRERISQTSMANIRGADIAAYRDRRLADGAASTTVNNELTLISHCYTVAIKEWGMESLRNPVSLVRRAKVPRGRERRITDDEERRLLEAAKPELRSFIVLALETGMRRGELVNLRWDDISGDVALLHDTKNNTVRKVPLSTRAKDTLSRLPRRIDGAVFGVTADAMTVRFRYAAQKAGIENLRLHDLRHEATSRLFERGLNIMEVAAIVGHKTLSMLSRYTHLRAEDLAKKLG